MARSRTSPASQHRDLDAAWKFVLAKLFRACLSFAAPHVAAEIDWDRSVEFLDKELRRIARRAKVSKRAVDVLAKVWRRSGEQVWLLVHVEVQSQKEEDFPRRMWLYHHLIYFQYDQMAYSVALLADDNPQWRPTEYRAACFDTKVAFEYRAVKLLDYQPQQAALRQSRNPFARVVEIFLAMLATQGKPDSVRLEAKLQLLPALLQAGFTEEEGQYLVEFLDWLIVLPAPLEAEFDRAWARLEEEQVMALTLPPSRLERRLSAKGREEGRVEAEQRAHAATLAGILGDLVERWGAVPPQIEAALREVRDLSQLPRLHAEAVLSGSPAAFESRLPALLQD